MTRLWVDSLARPEDPPSSTLAHLSHSGKGLAKFYELVIRGARPTDPDDWHNVDLLWHPGHDLPLQVYDKTVIELSSFNREKPWTIPA